MAYVRGNRAEFDVWEELANPRWNWDTMLPYYKKSERYYIPRADQLTADSILKPLGIETKIDLPGVGENLLEQPHHTLVHSGNLEESTNAFYAYVTAENLFGDQLAAVEASSRARIPEFARASVAASGDTGPDAHPIGTASMMSRELGGVVDPQLEVYGTAKVRVVDASVMPIQTSGHLTSTIYPLAERLSDIIKDAA
ncbi:hypothetical protein ACHAQH_003175 [Verticillium albo-atrum]